MSKKNLIITISMIIVYVTLALAIPAVVDATSITPDQLQSTDETTDDVVITDLNIVTGTNTLKDAETNIPTTNDVTDNNNVSNTNDSNNVANNTLAKAGLEDNAGIMMAIICAISAIYALKKVNDYKTK